MVGGVQGLVWCGQWVSGLGSTGLVRRRPGQGRGAEGWASCSPFWRVLFAWVGVRPGPERQGWRQTQGLPGSQGPGQYRSLLLGV